jgi:hypothetical protein
MSRTSTPLTNGDARTLTLSPLLFWVGVLGVDELLVVVGLKLVVVEVCPEEID